ncbi:MAG: winged helix-turn-helix domain-containing protein [Promethearchaeota archaeon]
MTVKNSVNLNPPLTQKEIEELISYKYLLGDFGIQIASAINKGAQNDDAIIMLSGVPMACVTGRLPVLMNLKLVEARDSKYYITKKGRNFLKCINECF